MEESKISIVTPSYNQGRFIKDTIESILDQKYSNYEHIIIDGGSTDETLSVINSYNHIKLISEPDMGPANAINKGFAMSTGDIVTWLNSDDYYDNNVFDSIKNSFLENPEVDFVYGNLTYVNEDKSIIYADKTTEYNMDTLLNYYADIIRQPAIFFKKSLLNHVGKLNESLKCVFDYDLFLKMIKISKLHYIDRNIAFVRDYDTTITRSNLRRQGFEILKVSKSHGGKIFNRLLLTTIYRKILFPHLSKIKTN